jgi:hypothetical protein
MEDFIRSDVLSGDRKSVHIKLKKELYLYLKGLCFKANISIQDLFQEFVEHLSKNSKTSHYILKSATTKKFKRSLERIKNADKLKGKRDNEFNAFDANSLYAILENLKDNPFTDDEMSDEETEE